MCIHPTAKFIKRTNRRAKGQAVQSLWDKLFMRDKSHFGRTLEPCILLCAFLQPDLLTSAHHHSTPTLDILFSLDDYDVAGFTF